ncbi:Reticulon-1 [Fukomys damarensis]|uniref:Reticulon n=1 Tax=Fukomys damarensis TaxID=885580 RepID=A0A091CLW4_FUKDA|nr:Reticulon-1 [Fukomys damarensis]
MPCYPVVMSSYRDLKTSVIFSANQFILRFSIYITIDLLYWRDIKQTGIVFGSFLLLLFSLTQFSVVSVVAYLALAALSATISFRIYKSVLQAVQKTDEGHPFKAYLELEITLSQEQIQKYTDCLQLYVNSTLKELRRLFLVQDLVDSLKFAVLMWLLTYVGALFNGLTLLLMAVVSMFTLPVVYVKHQAQIDQYLGLVRTHINAVVANKKQEELAKQHERFVRALNQTMREKSQAAIYINDTCARISSEREDVEIQRKHVQETKEQIAKQWAEYLLRKQQLTTQIDEFKKICELATKETFKKKEELEKLRNRMTKIKQTVSISTVVLSDHNLEIAQLQSSIKEWEEKVDEVTNACKILENKIDCESSAVVPHFNVIQLGSQPMENLAEKLHKVNLENKELQEKMHAILQQYRIVLTEEDQVFLQKRKLHDEYVSTHDSFVNQHAIVTGKETEEELMDTLPHLHLAEEEYTIKNRRLQELCSSLTAQKQEETLLNNYISHVTWDFSRYVENMERVKEELKQARDQESQKVKEHFEILKNLENEVYLHDQKADLLLLENKRLKEYISYLRNNTEEYRAGQDFLRHNSSDLSWKLIAQHVLYCCEGEMAFYATIAATVPSYKCKLSGHSIKSSHSEQ